MNDSPISTKSAPAAKRAGTQKPYPPTQTPPELPRDVAMQVAELARVSVQECEPFCDSVCDSVQMVWKRDRRAELSQPGEALKRGAQAARTLNQAFGSLNKADRKWVEKLLNQEPSWSQERLIGRVPDYEPLRELSITVWLLACLFSNATGEVSPLLAGTARLPVKPGREKGTVKDVMFQNFVRDLLIAATEAGGILTLDKNRYYKEGTLVEALDIICPYLPRGVIPYDLHLATLQRIKTKHSEYRRRLRLDRPAK